MRLLAECNNANGTTDCIFECPACGNSHFFRTGPGKGPRWTFNGDMAKPTFTPSLRILTSDANGKPVTTCHLNVTAGMIVFHPDCPHSFAGKTVPMLDLDAKVEVSEAPPVAAPDVQPHMECPLCHGTGVVSQSLSKSVVSTTACPRCVKE